MNRAAMMESARIVAGRCLVFLFLALAALAATAAEIWYEDNNLGKATGMPADFIEKFRQPEAFSQASRHISVYMIRANVLARVEDEVLSLFVIPYLKKHNIKLAIDAGGATWSQLSSRRKNVFDSNIALLRRLKQLGADVRYISLQSVLSKNPGGRGEKTDYPLDKRVEDIVAFSRAARAVYPQVEIGIIDALPSHGKEYREPYRLAKEAMERNGMKLSYIHLDMPFEIPRNQHRGVTWQKVREVEAYVEDDLGLKFGFFTTSRQGGRTSSKSFHDAVIAALDCYAGANGTPAHFIIASWFPHPQKTIPEHDLGDDYPAMRTVLQFGRRLEEIKTTGSGWPASRASSGDWRAQCGIN
jgi:hypothetical protein